VDDLTKNIKTKGYGIAEDAEATLGPVDMSQARSGVFKRFGQQLQNNPRGTLMQVGDLLKQGVTGYRTWEKSLAPVTDAPPIGIKVIDDDSQVEWRPRSTQEVARDKAAVDVRGSLLGSGLSRNLGTGSLLGWTASEMAEPLLKGTDTPTDIYIRREDFKGLEDDLQNYNEKMEGIHKENNTPYWD